MLKVHSKLAFKMKDLLTSLTGKVGGYCYSHVLKWYDPFLFQLTSMFSSCLYPSNITGKSSGRCVSSHSCTQLWSYKTPWPPITFLDVLI